MKACTTCGETKALSEFTKNRTRPDGLRGECRSCVRVRGADYYRRNKARVLAQQADRRRANPEAVRAYLAEYRSKNADRIRDGELLRMYGISAEAFAAMLDRQNGRCAIQACGATAPGGRGTWHIDHDHGCCPGKKSCGKCVRGLLCSTCNTGIGFLRDSPELLRSAAEYLIHYQKVACKSR